MDSGIRSALAFGALTLCLSAVFGWTVGHYLAINAEEQATARAQGVAARFADRLELTVWARAHEMLAFSTSAPLADPALRAQHARRLLDGIRQSLPAFSWIGVADVDGRIVHASGGEREGLHVGGSPAFRHARAMPTVVGTNEAVLTERASLAAMSGRPVQFLDMSVGTFDVAGNRTGVLLARLGWDWAVDSAAEFARTVDTGGRSELMVIAGDGTVVLSSDPSMTGRTVDTTMADSTQPGGRWSSIRRWPDGERYLTVATRSIGYRDFAGLGWTVLFRQPLDEALGESRTVPRKVAIATALVCALGLLIGWALGTGRAGGRNSRAAPVGRAAQSGGRAFPS